MKISVIIPVYNSEKTLKYCIDSIFQQTKKPYEIILVDDKSSDNSIKIAKNYKLKILKLNKNSGPAVTRNAGAKFARGEAILFLDSDVAMPVDCIERISKTFKEKKCDAIQTIYSPNVIYSKLPTDYQQVLYTYQFLKVPSEGSSIFATYCAAVKRNVFFKAGMFNTKIKRASAEDAEFGHVLAANRYNIYVDKGLHVKHYTQYTARKFFKRRYYMTKDLLKSYLRTRKHIKGKNTSSIHHTTLATLLSIPIPFIIIMSLVLGFFNPYSLILIFTLVFAYLLLQSSFLGYAAKKRGVAKATKFLLFSFIDQIFILMGFVGGFLSYYLLGERF